MLRSKEIWRFEFVYDRILYCVYLWNVNHSIGLNFRPRDLVYPIGNSFAIKRFWSAVAWKLLLYQGWKHLFDKGIPHWKDA